MLLPVKPSLCSRYLPRQPFVQAGRATTPGRCWCRFLATDWNQRDEFFHYTRARVVGEQNRARELGSRRVRFDMNALAQVAARSVGARSVVDVEKFPDGMYSKAFLMTTDDGRQVVAKVPNPNAGRPHYTTASEVATMDFVRPRPRSTSLYS